MSYHKFNNIAKLINADLTARIVWVILSRDLIDRECNCYNTYKVNRNCVYKIIGRKNCSINEVKFSMCDAIYIGNTEQTFKKRMDGHFSEVQFLLKYG